MSNVLVLGAGSRLTQQIGRLIPIRYVARHPARSGPEISQVADYRAIPSAVFEGVTTVINCVGCAHGEAETLDEVNCVVPINAARAGRVAGVRHFIQIGSLSVYGRATAIDRNTIVAPATAYGRSKAKADAGLAQLADDGFAVTIVRAPAIYGPGALGKIGKLAQLMRVARVLPVPRTLAARSVVHSRNVAAAIVALTARPAESSIEFVADHDPFTLATLAEAIKASGGPRVRLVPVPDIVTQLLRHTAPGLFASLYAPSLIDPGAAMTTAMTLPITLADGLASALAGR